MASDSEWDSNDGNRSTDQRDQVRHPYLAREILKAPPLEPRGGRLLPVKADVFIDEAGGLLADNRVAQHPMREALRPNTIALALPDGFDRQYGEALQGTRVSTMLATALIDHLDVPVSQFVVGNAYAGSQLATHMVIMDREAYTQMAKLALEKLADSAQGSNLIGMRNVELYRNALHDPSSNTSRLVDNLLANTQLSDKDIDALRSTAVASQNYEFVSHLNIQRKRAGGQAR